MTVLFSLFLAFASHAIGADSERPTAPKAVAMAFGTALQAIFETVFNASCADSAQKAIDKSACEARNLAGDAAIHSWNHFKQTCESVSIRALEAELQLRKHQLAHPETVDCDTSSFPSCEAKSNREQGYVYVFLTAESRCVFIDTHLDAMK